MRKGSFKLKFNYMTNEFLSTGVMCSCLFFIPPVMFWIIKYRIIDFYAIL